VRKTSKHRISGDAKLIAVDGTVIADTRTVVVVSLTDRARLNVRAFLAAYRDSMTILNSDDNVWLEPGKELKMTEEAIASLRDETRADMWSEFKPTTEADIRKVFDVLRATAGPQLLGFSQLPDGFTTREYQ
jgi:hypothetical protein